MPSTVTVTGDTGPGIAVAAAVISNVEEITIDPNDSLVTIKGVLGNMPPGWHEFDVKDQNTVTVTKSGNTWTITIA